MTEGKERSKQACEQTVASALLSKQILEEKTELSASKLVVNSKQKREF